MYSSSRKKSKRLKNKSELQMTIKFRSNVLAKNSTTEYRTNVRLGEVVCLSVCYNNTNSWLLSLTGFDFTISWRDSKNREYTV